MRHVVAAILLLGILLGSSSCRKQPEGTVKVIVIGRPPRLSDPAAGALSVPDAVLLANVAQGLVRFDSSGNVVNGLAERWTVSDDGLSYIFRLGATNWPSGRRVTARDVARILKREIGSRSRNSLKDPLGAVEDVVAMTDRVIEIRLSAPRPQLLSLLAQPEMAILRDMEGTGPFVFKTRRDGQITLTREIVSPDEETSTREEVILSGMPAPAAIAAFASASVDVVLGGSFADLAVAQRAKLQRNSLRFDPASGLFGLVPARVGGPLDKPEVRQLLSQAIDRESFVTALGVPGLAPRATLLEPGLDGVSAPIAPIWAALPFESRIGELQAEANRLFGKSPKPHIRIALPDGPGANLLLQVLQRNWGELGFTVERAERAGGADFALIDEVAPSNSAAWFVRRFRCSFLPVCDAQADQLMDGARQTPVPAQRYALIEQAAARLDEAQLFLPIAAPVRWSLVSPRVQNFSGNRYGRHTLTDLEAKPVGGE